MKIRSLCFAIAALLFCSQTSFGQGGPYTSDFLNPKAWPNPVYGFQASWLDPFFPQTVIQGQTVWVATRSQLQQKQKDYYVFMDHNKQNGSAEGGWVSSTQHMAYLKWNDPNDGSNTDYYYPSEAGFDTIFDAIPFSQLDQRCFQNFNGPYCKIVDNPFFVGQVSGYPWVAFSNILRPMGGEFKQSQIDKIKESNKARNSSTMKSDLRAGLVNQFLALHPELAGQIPVDTVGNTLNNNANSDSHATVAHILPRIAPEGNACGRNAFRNALLVSKKMKKKLDKAGYPSEGFIMYCEWLATKYNKKLPQPTPPKAITYVEVEDLSQLARMDVEYLTEDETIAFLDYVDKSDRR